MSDLIEAVLLVCTRCNYADTQHGQTGLRSGRKLLEAIQALPKPLAAIHVQPIACLSGCKRACTVALTGPGKVGDLFGDLPPDANAASAVTTLAARYVKAPNGYLPRASRPTLLRDGILARLPPVDWAGSGEIIWPTS